MGANTEIFGEFGENGVKSNSPGQDLLRCGA